MPPAQNNLLSDQEFCNAEQQQLILVPAIGKHRDDFFTGSTTCAQCHTSIFSNWQSTNHARHFQRDKCEVPHSGNCERCHVTGNSEYCVGCEACHGPSGTHSLYPSRTVAPDCVSCEVAKACIRCHTRTINPSFNVASQIRKIDHGPDDSHPETD